jgi:cysteine synthase
MPNQFDNPELPGHYHTTAPEIFSQTAGGVDALVARWAPREPSWGAPVLRGKKPSIRIVGVEPHRETPFQAEEHAGIHRAGDLDPSKLDRFITSTDDVAFETTATCSVREGLFAG